MEDVPVKSILDELESLIITKTAILGQIPDVIQISHVNGRVHLRVLLKRSFTPELEKLWEQRTGDIPIIEGQRIVGHFSRLRLLAGVARRN